MNPSTATTTPNAVVGPTIASVPTKARKVGWGVALAVIVIVAVVVFAMKAFETGNNSAGGEAQPAAAQQNVQPSSPAQPATN